MRIQDIHVHLDWQALKSLRRRQKILLMMNITIDQSTKSTVVIDETKDALPVSGAWITLTPREEAHLS